eukprot:m.287842 g.287842  ORF g.287842 m.287842 type:complete len:130 (+) comp19953_c0_seq12:106-495(+)
MESCHKLLDLFTDMIVVRNTTLMLELTCSMISLGSGPCHVGPVFNNPITRRIQESLYPAVQAQTRINECASTNQFSNILSTQVKNTDRFVDGSNKKIRRGRFIDFVTGGADECMYICMYVSVCACGRWE